jgi:hypothetical protein
VVARCFGDAAVYVVPAVGMRCTVLLEDLDFGLAVGFVVESHLVAAALDCFPVPYYLTGSLGTGVAVELGFESCYTAIVVVLVVVVVADSPAQTAAHYTGVEAGQRVLVLMSWVGPACMVRVTVEGQDSSVPWLGSID